MNENPTPKSSEQSVSSTDLLDMISRLDKQVADLQADQIAVKRPWWRDALTVITLLALMFSIATALFSFSQSNQQRRHNLRTEFREISLRLSELPRQQLDIAYSDKSRTVVNSYFVSLQDERRVLLGQADAIATQISDDLGWSEYYLLGDTAQESLEYKAARSYYASAATKTKEIEHLSQILRAEGAMEMDLGEVDKGRQKFSEAIQILEKESETNSAVLSSIELTYYVWYVTEYRRDNCNEFYGNYQKAKNAREISNRANIPNGLVNVVDYSDSYASTFTKCPPQK